MRVRLERLGLIVAFAMLMVAGLLAMPGTGRAQTPRICGSTGIQADIICGGAGPNGAGASLNALAGQIAELLILISRTSITSIDDKLQDRIL